MEKFWGAAKGTRSPLFLLALVVIGIFFMFISANPEHKPETLKAPVESSEVIAQLGGKSDYKESLERELSAFLRRVKGVGDVVVVVTLESGAAYEYGENRDTTARTTQEQDSNGGNRLTEENTLRTQFAFIREGNGEKPLITREIQPRLRGVMVVAGGAEDPVVKERIIRALQAGLNLDAHRVTVLPMK